MMRALYKNSWGLLERRKKSVEIKLIKEGEAHEELATNFQTQGANHATHYGIANLTPLQVQSPNSCSDYDSGRMIEIAYKLQHAQGVMLRGGYILWKHPRFHDHRHDKKMLMDLEDEDDNNLHFFQNLKQAIAITSQPIVESTPITIPSFSKPNQSQFGRKK